MSGIVKSVTINKIINILYYLPNKYLNKTLFNILCDNNKFNKDYSLSGRIIYKGCVYHTELEDNFSFPRLYELHISLTERFEKYLSFKQEIEQEQEEVDRLLVLTLTNFTSKEDLIYFFGSNIVDQLEHLSFLNQEPNPNKEFFYLTHKNTFQKIQNRYMENILLRDFYAGN